MEVQCQFVALEQSTYTYIFPPFGMVLVFDLGSAFALFHWSVLPRLVISSNHMESLLMPPSLQTYTKLFYASI